MIAVVDAFRNHSYRTLLSGVNVHILIKKNSEHYYHT